MRIAVIGSGIAGLASAWLLSKDHDVVLFEANDYLGGHTHTHDILLHGKPYRVDSGFIVHNRRHYPLLHRLFDELGVTSKATAMSFSVQHASSGREYNASTLDGLFCQRRNLWSPRFIGMVRDLLRFYREAPALLEGAGPGPSLGDYLGERRYGAAFRDEHLVPMASALWSSPAHAILQFPARYLVQFMANHQMLQTDDRPQWQVVEGGSSTYIEAMRRRWNVQERLACPVHAVRRHEQGVAIASAYGHELFDQAVLACHSDQALALLRDPSEREQDILGAITYQANDAVLHTDARLLPRHPKAWAAWNAYVPQQPTDACTVSYCMNHLQGFASPEPFIVTLNRSYAIDPAKIHRRMQYHHPVYTAASVSAQARKHEIQGQRHTWYAGAYWGWGFHEDGMRSAVDVAQAINGHAVASSRSSATEVFA
ncbi:FAD-dependent oxidoreductase [Dyella sp. C11]|uniref:NAD(P)/FAD-dependent oxidoreductase n=1 Tax=Dyella sp. C11 TaxID=2126991 RepID=UPI000D65E495|nr:FAD-dependent oxidoreductase [Dyella sp. C11]